MVRRTVIAAAVALALGGAGLAGCGSQDAADAVKSVRSDVQSRVDRARERWRDEIDRAQARVDDLVAEAKDDGVDLGRLRARADDALEQSRAEADRAIARAKKAGDSAGAERLKADARKRIKELRARIDDALGGDAPEG